MYASASGGTSETAQKALTVRPRGRESRPNAVRTTTPLGKVAMTSRERWGSIIHGDHRRMAQPSEYSHFCLDSSSFFLQLVLLVTKPECLIGVCSLDRSL